MSITNQQYDQMVKDSSPPSKSIKIYLLLWLGDDLHNRAILFLKIIILIGYQQALGFQ